jgi:hypothetical protein
LTLFAIRLYVYPVSLLITMAGTLSGYELSTWRTLISQSSTVLNALWGFLLVFELMVNLTMIVFSVFLIFLFRKRRHTFPKLFITTGAIWAGVVGFDLVAAQLLIRGSPVTPEPVSPGVIGEIVVTVLWCFYLAYSARVKATFTESLQPNRRSPGPRLGTAESRYRNR